jgi:hypothetical protein
MAASASAQVHVSALMSMVARNKDAALQSNQTNFGITTFDGVYGRLFLDAAVTDRLSAFVQFFSHDYDGALFYGAYVRYDHTPNTHLEAGLLPVPVGLWPPRTYADKNPLVAVPAIYQYKTPVDGYKELQTSPDELLDERGQSGYAPLVYEFCWNTGLHAYGSFREFDVGIALLNGSLGSPRREVVYNRPAGAVHVSWVPSPYAVIGGWISAGPYLSPSFEPGLPNGKKVEDYNQLTGGALLQFSAGHAELNAEMIVNRFEHPFLGNLDNLGGYADIKYTFATRWWGAARFDALSFSELDDPSVDGEKWDYPLMRIELGVGRRLSERSLLKAVTQIVRRQDAPDSFDGETYAVQFTVEL